MPFAVYALLGIKPSTSCVLGKCSVSWLHTPVLFAHYKNKLMCFSLTKLVYYIFFYQIYDLQIFFKSLGYLLPYIGRIDT